MQVWLLSEFEDSVN